MKIEKISDTQIRCTLNKNDLASRQIKISELAYGTEKAKGLFRDMMQQASYEFGFEADDLPLMIEAIPMSAESIVLIITKVDDPEELDTRFSKFAPTFEDDFDGMEDMEYDDLNMQNGSNGADEVLGLFPSDDDNDITDEEDNIFARLNGITQTYQPTPDEDSKEKSSDTANLVRIYSFRTFKDVEHLSSILRDMYHGRNSLYKDTFNQVYYLVVNKSEHTPAEFNKVCNILSEYGRKENVTVDKEAFFREHYYTVIRDSALQILADIV